MGHLKYLPVAGILFACNSTPLTNENMMVEGGNVNMFGDSLLAVQIPGLMVQQHEVTNAEFEAFVHATGYITSAEKNGNGMVFNRRQKKWELATDANWKHPQGKSSSIKNKMNHPVVQVSYEDACAYCEWKEMRLPYESEWEYVFEKDGEALSFNYWQGIFPYEDKGEDGFVGTAPVGSFKPGKTGCLDLRGNVWEWCNDYYHELWPQQAGEFPDSVLYKGPSTSYSGNNIYDTLRVIKGGSFLCADNYCRGYTSHTKMHADPNLGYEHVGFRCVKVK